MSLTNKRRAIKTSFTSSNNSKWFLKQQHQPQKHLQLWFKIVIIVVVIKLIPAMLPPPLTTPRTLSTTISGTTMGIQMTTTTNNHNHNHNHQQQQQHHNNLQQKQQQTQQHHYESAFFYESMNSSNDATPSNASASFATASSSTTNLKGLKTFLRKTLVNVTNTTVNDSLSLYTSSSVASQLPASSSSSSSSLPSSSREELYDDIVVGTISESVSDGDGTGGFVGNITDDFGSYATAAAAADMAVMTLSNTTTHLETTTAAAAAFPSATQTVATFIAGNKNRATTIIVYPTVSPESIVIPIVSCIFGFPILAFIVICCLRHRAKLARERDRRRNYDMQDHAVSLVRFSPIHRLNYRSSRAISLRPERSLSQGFTSLELDTVVEERVSDVEQTQTEMLHPESPMESSTSYKMSLSSS